MRALANLPEVIRAHDRFIRRFDFDLRDSLHDAGEYGLRYANTHPRFTPRTGETQRANQAKVMVTRNRGTVRLSNRKAHAAALDMGARPHDIKPRRPGGRLVFYWPKVGKVVFARRVKHPGNRPYRFLHGATQAMGRNWHAEYLRRAARTAKTFGS